MEGLENIVRFNIGQVRLIMRKKQYIVCHILFNFSDSYGENWGIKAYGPNGQVFIINNNVKEKEKLTQQWIDAGCPCCGSCAKY